MTLNISNHNGRLLADQLLVPQNYSKGFVNNKPVFDRNLTFIDHVSQFLRGVKMVTRILAGIRKRYSGFTYCHVTDTCCFHEIHHLHYRIALSFMLNMN